MGHLLRLCRCFNLINKELKMYDFDLYCCGTSVKVDLLLQSILNYKDII